VLVAAFLSPSGAATGVMTLHYNKLIQIVISEYVLLELQRSRFFTASTARDRLAQFLLSEPIVLALPTAARVNRAATVISAKDAPILAGAKAGRVTALVTWDKEFLKDDVVRWLGRPIDLPKDFLQRFRLHWTR